MTPERIKVREFYSKPQKLTKEDKIIIEDLIGTKSSRHRELYVRATLGGEPYQAEIWYLAPIALDKSLKDPAKVIEEDYEIDQRAAEAAVKFCRAFPEAVKRLHSKHNNAFGWRHARLADSPLSPNLDPQKVLNLKP